MSWLRMLWEVDVLGAISLMIVASMQDDKTICGLGLILGLTSLWMLHKIESNKL